MSFSNSFIKLLSFLTLLLDAGLLLLLGLYFFRSLRLRAVLFSFIKKYALSLSLTAALSAVIGSLILSDGIGFEPCILCWYQRIFLYPQALLFAIALKKRDNSIFTYTLPLSYIGGAIALYQSYVQWGGASFLSCTATGSACAKIFFTEFGYITIPVMSLTAFLLLIAIAYIKKAKI